MIGRRSLLGSAGGALAVPLLASRRAHAQASSGTPPAPGAAPAAPSGSLSERSFGHADAKVTVTEFFSLTCTHCAAFSREVMPDVTQKLVDTGQVRFVYWDFPLDQVALTAAMVARALPPERYEPFVSALFASQDRWAFARGVNSTEELAKMAMLAGLSRPQFDAAINDTALKNAILTHQQQAEDKYKVDSTPTFMRDGKTRAGEMAYADFAAFVGSASG